MGEKHIEYIYRNGKKYDSLGEFRMFEPVKGTTLMPYKQINDDKFICVCNVCGAGVYSTSYTHRGISNIYEREELRNPDKLVCRNCEKLKSVAKEEKLNELKAKLKEDLGVSPTSSTKSGEQAETYDIMHLLDEELRVLMLSTAKVTPITITNDCIATFDMKTTADGNDSVSKRWSELLKGTSVGSLDVIGVICSGVQNKVVKGYMHTLYNTPKKVVLKCRDCGGYTFTGFSTNIFSSSVICSNCSTDTNKDTLGNPVKMQPVSVVDSRKKIKNSRSILQGIGSKLDEIKSKPEYKKDFDSVKSFRSDCVVVDAQYNDKSSDSEIDLTLVCSRCGSILTYNRNMADIEKNCKCTSGDKTPFVGKMHQNWVGSIHNFLIITYQEGYMCDVKCHVCGAEHKDLSLYDVLQGKCCCSCSYSVIDTECDDCGNFSAFKLKDVIRGAKLKCSECKKVLDRGLVLLDISASDKRLSFKRLNSGTASLVPANDSNLLREQQESPLYIGRDGEKHYRAMCFEHNKSIILTEQEIQNYNHEYCDCLETCSTSRIETADIAKIKL